MEIAKTQTHNCLKNNTFALTEQSTLRRKEYFAKYYQQNKEQKKRERRIKYKALKLGLDLKLVNGVFNCGTKSDTKTYKEYNRTFYLKQKGVNVLVSSVEQKPQHTPLYLKEIKNKEKGSDTKTYSEKLRDCGTILPNICNILKSDTKTKNKGGRPKTANPLTNAEKQKRKRAKAKKLNLILKMLDNNRVRIETKDKVPFKKNHPLNGWKNWVEKKNISELMEKNGEWGARVGKEVKYYGRKYSFNWLDNDILKKAGIPDEVRKEVFSKCVEWNNKMGIAYVKGNGGLGIPILSKEPLPDFNISFGDYKPAEILSKDRQAQIESEWKEWHWGKPLIVKNAWGLCQIFNRKETGWRVEEKNRRKIVKKTWTNTNIYQPQELQQNYNELLKEHQEKQIFIRVEKIKKIIKLAEHGNNQPHIAYTDNFFFYFNAYHSNQAKLLNYEGQTLQLEIKRGRSHLFLNKIIRQSCQI